MLESEEIFAHSIVVTRWFGAKRLGGDSFRRVQDCVNNYRAR